MGRNAETEVQSEEERRGLRNAPQFYVWLKYKTRLLASCIGKFKSYF